MKIVITVMDVGGVELSYKRGRKPEIVEECWGNIKFDEDKLYEALEKAKEAVKEDK